MQREVMVARIYLGEADHGRRRSLMQEIMNVLHDQHRVQGVTVFRGIAGFGDTGEVHASDLLRLMVDLPLVIEFFDEPPVVEAVLGAMTELLAGHSVVSWRAALNRNDAPATR